MFPERIEFLQRKFGLLFSQDDKVIFFNPESVTHCLSLSFDNLVTYQTFYPVVDQLETAGIKCVQNISQQKFNLAIISIPKSKKLARHLIYLATKAVPEGLIIVDGDKTSGVESIIRDLKKLQLEFQNYPLPLLESLHRFVNLQVFQTIQFFHVPWK